MLLSLFASASLSRMKEYLIFCRVQLGKTIPLLAHMSKALLDVSP